VSDFIIKTGDTVVFNPVFGPALVTVAPGTISGTGKAKVDGSIVCVLGDEASVTVSGVAYTVGLFTIPGTGTLTIAALGFDQIGKKTSSLQTAVILKGSTFTALFTASVRAGQPNPPSPPTPDPVGIFTGSGQFVTTNARVKGT
jgi:contractile injection system spike tip protein